MASLRRSKQLSPEGQTARFLYTILKQLDLKPVDWTEVAASLDITNGHAARMRYSRFKQQIEGIPTQPRTSRPKKASAKCKTMNSERSIEAHSEVLKKKEDSDDDGQGRTKRFKLEPDRTAISPYYNAVSNATSIPRSNVITTQIKAEPSLSAHDILTWNQPLLSTPPRLPHFTPMNPTQVKAEAPRLREEAIFKSPTPTTVSMADLELPLISNIGEQFSFSSALNDCGQEFVMPSTTEPYHFGVPLIKFEP